MLLKRSELVRALDAVKGAVAAKAYAPILTHVLIDGATVMAFDGEVGIKVSLSESIGGKFNCRFDMLYNLLKALDAEELSVEVQGTEKIAVRCGRHKSTMSQISEEFPKPQIPKNSGGWTQCPTGFKEGLERALIAAHENESEKVLSGVLIHGSAFYSCNRTSGVICAFEGMEAPRALLSRKAVTEIIRLGQPTRFAIAGPWAIFDYTNLTFLARLREGAEEFPPVWDLVKIHQLDQLEMHPLPEGIVGVLTRLKLFGGEDTSTAIYEGKNDGGSWLELKSQNERAAASEILDTDMGAPHGKRFNPEELLKALPYSTAMSWGVTDKPIYMTGENGFQYFLTPMRSI